MKQEANRIKVRIGQEAVPGLFKPTTEKSMNKITLLNTIHPKNNFTNIVKHVTVITFTCIRSAKEM
jgi:hypothetical protein